MISRFINCLSKGIDKSPFNQPSYFQDVYPSALEASETEDYSRRCGSFRSFNCL